LAFTLIHALKIFTSLENRNISLSSHDFFFSSLARSAFGSFGEAKVCVGAAEKVLCLCKNKSIEIKERKPEEIEFKFQCK
jgi:hypothetical protein